MRAGGEQDSSRLDAAVSLQAGCWDLHRRLATESCCIYTVIDELSKTESPQQ